MAQAAGNSMFVLTNDNYVGLLKPVVKWCDWWKVVRLKPICIDNPLVWINIQRKRIVG
jgi:hypothetical protein